LCGAAGGAEGGADASEAGVGATALMGVAATGRDTAAGVASVLRPALREASSECCCAASSSSACTWRQRAQADAATPHRAHPPRRAPRSPPQRGSRPGRPCPPASKSAGRGPFAPRSAAHSTAATASAPGAPSSSAQCWHVSTLQKQHSAAAAHLCELGFGREDNDILSMRVQVSGCAQASAACKQPRRRTISASVLVRSRQMKCVSWSSVCRQTHVSATLPQFKRSMRRRADRAAHPLHPHDALAQVGAARKARRAVSARARSKREHVRRCSAGKRAQARTASSRPRAPACRP
jgi:hypothetical protein